MSITWIYEEPQPFWQEDVQYSIDTPAIQFAFESELLPFQAKITTTTAHADMVEIQFLFESEVVAEADDAIEYTVFNLDWINGDGDDPIESEIF